MNVPNTKHNLKVNQEIYRSSNRAVGPGDNTAYFMYGQNGKNKVQKYYSSFQGSKVYTYTLTKRPYLIRMDSVKSIEHLLNKAPNLRIRNAILGSFSIANKNGTNYSRVIRNSQMARNKVVSDFVCSLGFDGYIANVMPKSEGGMFHQELVLCIPYNKLNKNPNVELSSEAPSAPSKRKVNTINVTPMKNYSPNVTRRAMMFNSPQTPRAVKKLGF